MEPTPIFAAMADAGTSPTTGSGHPTGRSVTDLVRDLRAERAVTTATTTATTTAPSSEVGTGGRARVGHVPGLLSFRLPV